MYFLGLFIGGVIGYLYGITEKSHEQHHMSNPPSDEALIDRFLHLKRVAEAMVSNNGQRAYHPSDVLNTAQTLALIEAIKLP